MGVIWFVFAALALSWASILWTYRREILRCWQEPTLKHPVFIIESDDWGPGPHADAQALDRIAETLQQFQDSGGRHPVMTLGLVLSVPDGPKIEESSFCRYWRVELDDARTQSVLEAMCRGIRVGVFSAQLHGHDHFWPPSLMQASFDDAKLNQWFCGHCFPRTEALPPHLQSRWVDAATLPSTELDATLIRDALAAEFECFERVFGTPPAVYVPPTFVWSDMVERTLAEFGVKALVTPGRRSAYHGASGELVGDRRRYFNGQSVDSMIVLVRDIYFEPIRGHTADRTLPDVLEHYRLGRPALLETHRGNFIGTQEERRAGLEELSLLLSGVLENLPDTRFLSSEELASIYQEGRRDLIEGSRVRRLQTLVVRLARFSRMRKLAVATGLGVVAWLFVLGARRGAPSPAA